MKGTGWVIPLLTATAGAATLGLAASGCATALTAGADFNTSADFTRYTSFAWVEADAAPVGDPRLENNPFFTERLHHAIQAQLDRRGIRHRSEGASLLIHHHASVRHHTEVYQADLSAGYITEEYGPGTQIVDYEEGTFLVDIADAETREILWRGWAVADIDAALEDPERMSELLDRATELMFERFPVAPVR